ISKNIGVFLGTFGGSPHSSPRGRRGFAEGEARRTSVFMRFRALEGPEGSQKKQAERTSLLFREIENASTNDVQIAWNSKDRSDVAVVCSKHWRGLHLFRSPSCTC